MHSFIYLLCFYRWSQANPPVEFDLALLPSNSKVSDWKFEFSNDEEGRVLIEIPTDQNQFQKIIASPRLMNDFSIQATLPLVPSLVNYFEISIISSASTTTIVIGLSSRPYPSFRLPGWNRNSFAFHGDDGNLYCNNPYDGVSYERSFGVGDVVGCGIKNRTLYFTKNGKSLRKTGVAFADDSSCILFPSVGFDGSCVLLVNFGQQSFVFSK